MCLWRAKLPFLSLPVSIVLSVRLADRVRKWGGNVSEGGGNP